ncbi:DNA cytosine methyltransferase [Tardiphaga sp. 215_C5_N2_1]|uniref:DNA cytosine methyltransferase n=1 Tax=Tardiphaga sp. 215_C5_N2_1 TaxID=3240774 RepID=UPI003F8878C4
MARPIGIDLFAGAGGMSLGFEQAGFDVRAAVEIDPIHCSVHKFNFPDCAVLPRSVQEVTGADIRRAAGIGDAPVDVVFGGPPCQGFSLIGHRSFDDPRNQLVLDFVRIVSELDARAFVFENVKGLTVGKQRTFLNEIISAFQDAGYDVRTEWQVLNAAHYGVPQYRERLILLGAKRGTKVPNYPKKMTFAADETPELGLRIGPSCKDALGDLPNADQFAVLEDGDAVKAKYGKASLYASEMRCQSNDAWHYGFMRAWEPSLMTSSARTGHSEISQSRFSATPPGSVEPISRFFKLSPKGLSNTLRAGTDGARGAFTSPRPIHYAHPRCITVREMARLHGFPDWFRLHATKWHGARQIGNAVPPPLARAVASEVLKALGIRPRRSNRVVELGDPSLLGMVMSEAAEYFSVSKPNTKRDRKSGAKKRTQFETEVARLAALEAVGG